MADNTLALQVQPTQFGNNFSAGFNNGMAQQRERQQQEAAAFEQLAQIGFGVMDGNLDGPIDPAKLEQASQLLGSSPLAAKIKEDPEFLRTITKGSLKVLQFSQDSEKFELAKKQLEADLAAAQQNRELKTREMDLTERAQTFKESQPLSVSAGETLLDPETRKPIYTEPPKPPTPTDDQRELEQINAERDAAGQKALSMEEFLAAKRGAGLSIETNPDGSVKVTQGGKLTEGQSKDIGFYTRGLQANQGLANLEGQLTDFWMSKADLIPLGIGNYAKTPEFRQAKIEGDNFLTAILRKDTGAAITDKEFDIYGPMFLPIPGDDEGTIALKRQKRATALMAIRSGLGTAEAVAAANEGALGLDPPTKGARGGEDVVTDWTDYFN